MTTSFKLKRFASGIAILSLLGSIAAFSFQPIEPALAVGETCNGLAATIVGTSNNDSLNGTNGNDVIVGLGGNDTINGLNGNDTICGGDGNDDISGGNGNDWIDGGIGQDDIDGGNDVDTLRGGDDNDVLEGGNGNDLMYGEEGNDTIDAEGGDDTMDGGNGIDVCDGGTGTNTSLNCESGSGGSSSSASSVSSASSASSVASSVSSVASSAPSSAASSASSASSVSSTSSVSSVASSVSSASSASTTSSSSAVSTSASSVSSGASSAVSSSVSSTSSSTSSSSSAGIGSCVSSDRAAYWNFDENAGIIANDTSGNGHIGVLTGSPTWSAGPISFAPNTSALAFDGVDDEVIVPGTGLEFGTTAFTVSVFMKANTGNRSILGHYDNIGLGNRGWGLYVYSDGKVNFFGYGDQGTNDTAHTAGLLDNNWHHVVGVYKRSGASLTIDVYIDGVLKGTHTATVGDMSIPTLMRLGRYGTQPFFLGSMDEVRLYGRELTSGEISQLAAGCGTVSSSSSSSTTSTSSSSTTSSTSSSTSSGTSSTSTTSSSTTSSSSSSAGGSTTNNNGGQGLTIPSGEDGNSGAYRGWRTNTMGGVVNFFASLLFGQGSNGIARGAFGGSNDIPLSESEKKYLCTLKRGLPEVVPAGMLAVLAEQASSQMQRSITLITNALKRDDLCGPKISASAGRIVAVKVPFPVDKNGVPVSENETWRSCVQGRVTLQQIRDNENVDCADYHTQESWFHPDLKIYFTWNRQTNTLVVPAGFEVTTVAVTY